MLEIVCLKEACQQLCNLIELLSIIIDDLKCNQPAKPDCNLIEILKEIFRIIQNSKYLFLTDQCGEIIDQSITPDSCVYGFGFRLDIGCLTVTIDHKFFYATDCKKNTYPINLLLDHHFCLDVANKIKFIEALCQIKEFYKQLSGLCPKLLESYECQKGVCSNTHNNKKCCH